MKLIITIPKEKYSYIQELERGNTDYATTRMLYHAVKHGTPLDDVKAENKGEWIPVSERLPEEEEEVLCQLSDDSCAVLYMQDNWGQMEWVDGQMGTGTYDVIAWQPLPEPYKAESEE